MVANGDGVARADDVLPEGHDQEPGTTARLMRLASRLSQAVTAHQVAQAVVAASHAELGADAVTVYALDDVGTRFELLAAGHMAPDLQRRFTTVPYDADLPAGESLRSGTVLVYETIEERNRRWPTIASTAGMPTTVVAPMVLQGDIRLGVVSIGWQQPRRVAAADRAFAQAVADLCGQALHRARLHDAQRRGHATQRLLAEATARLAESLDPDRTLAQIAAAAVPVLADACAVCLVDPDDPHVVRPVAAVHAEPDRQEVLDQLVARQPELRNPRLLGVVDTGEPLLLAVDDAHLAQDAEDADHRRLLDAFGATSGLAVPLRTRGEVLGLLVLISTTDRLLGQADLAVATDLADRAAMALSNARLHARLQDRAGHLERALHSRIVIEQAKGMLAARHGLDVDTAFDRLRSTARSRRMRIHDLAAAVVAGEEDLADGS